MADQQSPRRSAPRVEVDQSEASVFERRRALRDAEREFQEMEYVGGGDLLYRVVSKVEEYPDFHTTFELTEVEPPQTFMSFFFPLLPGWWRLMRILFFGGRRARIWQVRITVDDLAEAEIAVVKGDPDGPFNVKGS